MPGLNGGNRTGPEFRLTYILLQIITDEWKISCARVTKFVLLLTYFQNCDELAR